MDQGQDLHVIESGRGFLVPMAIGATPLFLGGYAASRLMGSHPVAGGVALLLGLALGVGSVLIRIATRWTMLRRRGDLLILVPRMRVEALPEWLTGMGSAPRAAEGGLEVPLAGASLEWVGSVLVLHSSVGAYQLGHGDTPRRQLGMCVSDN
jgi:hypothetical protein